MVIVILIIVLVIVIVIIIIIIGYMGYPQNDELLLVMTFFYYSTGYLWEGDTRSFDPKP